MSSPINDPTEPATADQQFSASFTAAQMEALKRRSTQLGISVRGLLRLYVERGLHADLVRGEQLNQALLTEQQDYVVEGRPIRVVLQFSGGQQQGFGVDARAAGLGKRTAAALLRQVADDWERGAQ